MISMFPLWTFHLYVATFQKHLHMHISQLILYSRDGSYRDVLDKGLLLTRKLLNQGLLLVKLEWYNHFESLMIATMTWLTVTEYLCHNWPQEYSTCRKHFRDLSSFIPEHMSSPTVLSGVRVSWSFVYCALFVRSMFVLLYFFFWPFCFLTFLDLRILITPLVSSNSFYSNCGFF
jgi:hypothetical protein